MATLTVSLPIAVKDWVESKIRSGEYESSGEYVAELIERDRALSELEDEDTEELRRVVEEARGGGMSGRTVQDIFDGVVARARAKGTLRD